MRRVKPFVNGRCLVAALMTLVLALMTLVLLSGCAHLGLKLEQPQVKVVSLKVLPAEGMEQRFGIGLRITNPNGIGINLVGMSYSLRLQGYDLLSGVANDIPEIPAYSEVPLEIIANVDLFNGLRFIQSLLEKPTDQLSYELVAKLELESSLLPAIRIVERGSIALSR